MGAWTLRRADELGLRRPERGVVLLLCPAFHPVLALRLEDLGADGVWLEALHDGDHRDCLSLLCDTVLAPAEGTALLARVAAAAGHPRCVLDGQVRDGITGAARIRLGHAELDLAGHYALLGPDDPLHDVTELLLSAAEPWAPGPVATVRRYL